MKDERKEKYRCYMAANVRQQELRGFLPLYAKLELYNIDACWVLSLCLRMWSQMDKCQNVSSGSMLQFHQCHDTSMWKVCQEVMHVAATGINPFFLLHIVFRDIVSAQNGSLAKLTGCFNYSTKLVLQAVVAFKRACSTDKFEWSPLSCFVEIFFLILSKLSVHFFLPATPPLHPSTKPMCLATKWSDYVEMGHEEKNWRVQFDVIVVQVCLDSIVPTYLISLY